MTIASFSSLRAGLMQLPPLLTALRAHALAGAAALALLAVCSGPAMAQGDTAGQYWVATWGTAPATQSASDAAAAHTFSGQTVRLIVRTSVGGTQVRIRLSNEQGTMPLAIGTAHIALRKSGADIVAASDRRLTFGGVAAVVIAPGAPVLSDPVELVVPAQADLAVSLYLDGATPATTVHAAAYQTSYVSAPGNHAGAAVLPTQRTLAAWPFLTEVDVRTEQASAAIVTLGDSITDGAVTTTDANRRWPDLLMARLRAAREAALATLAKDRDRRRRGAAPSPVDPGARLPVPAALAGSAGFAESGELAIVNRGIGGNRLLRDPVSYGMFGRAALARFDRDVLATTGVKYMIVLIGINDIGHPGSDSAPIGETVSAAELIAGYRQLIARAHAKGIRVFGATMTPFQDTVFPNYYSAEKEAVRQAANDWIRTSGEFDAVIDFDRVLRDPRDPGRLLASYDSGDHLHPNDKGMQAMADAIGLDLFRCAARSVPLSASRSEPRSRPRSELRFTSRSEPRFASRPPSLPPSLPSSRTSSHAPAAGAIVKPSPPDTIPRLR